MGWIRLGREETIRARKVSGPSKSKTELPFTEMGQTEWWAGLEGNITFENAKLNMLVINQNETSSSQLSRGFKEEVRTKNINLKKLAVYKLYLKLGDLIIIYGMNTTSGTLREED